VGRVMVCYLSKGFFSLFLCGQGWVVREEMGWFWVGVIGFVE